MKKIEVVDPKVKQIYNNILKKLLKGETVTIVSFGEFKIVHIKSRTLMHNTGKRIIKTKPYKKITFTMTPLIKELINRKK